MSGSAPDWIKPGHYILYCGEKTVVKDYHFVSAPGYNTDDLVVRLKGHAAAEFNGKSMRPLPVEKQDHVPPQIHAGAIVELKDGRLDFVSRIWVSQEAGKAKRDVMVDLENYPFPQKLTDLHPPKDEKAVGILLKKKLDDEARRKFFKMLNKKKKGL